MSARSTGRAVEVRGVTETGTDPLVEHGFELVAFTDAAVLRDADEMPVARAELVAVAGEAAAVRAAAVAANFEAVNRLMDGLGVRVGPAMMRFATQLGLDVPGHLRPL